MFIFMCLQTEETHPRSLLDFVRKLESNLFGAKIASFVEDIMLWIETIDGKELKLHMT